MTDRLPLKNKKGASSVLVILMMVVLVLFGLSALTAGLASLRLTEKSSMWSEGYYLLEGNAEEKMAKIDGLLYEAEKRAVGYIEDKEYLEKSGTVFPDDVQKTINRYMTGSIPKTARGDYLERVMEAVYYINAYELMMDEAKDVAVDCDNNMTRMILEDEGFTGMHVKMTVSDGKKNIDVMFDVRFPGYLIDYNDGNVSGSRSEKNPSRYDIMVWEEWQEPFSYSENIQYADPVKD